MVTVRTGNLRLRYSKYCISPTSPLTLKFDLVLILSCQTSFKNIKAGQESCVINQSGTHVHDFHKVAAMLKYSRETLGIYNEYK